MLASKAFLVLQGLTVGLLINTLLFLFTGVVLGWGLSAPEWYVHIQGKILLGIMAFSVIASLLVFRTADRRRDREAETVIPET
jgi:membrane protein DedA with SNARE-associated domain